MFILTEHEATADLSKLEQAWSQPETFAFQADRSAVADSWVETSIESLPAELRTGHFVLLTSGSTGEPRLVVGARDRAEQLARVLHSAQESESVRQTILTLPLTYCYAFVNQWLWAFVMRRGLVPTRGFGRPDELKRALLDAREAMLCLVGAQLNLFAMHYTGISFPGITRLHFAGGPFPQNEMSFVRRMFPSAMIFNNYGCAEAMPRLTLRKLDESDDGANIGRPLPRVEMKTGERDEILFRSPYRAVAHLDSEGMRRIRDEEWIPSGDLGHEVEGGYWKLTGRASEVFKRYGEKIALPQLVETVKRAWQGQAAFYREKDAMGEDGHVLVLAPAPDESQLTTVLHAFREHHPRVHWPLRVESVASMPLLPNGKIDVNALATLPAKTTHWRQRI
ncbi:MAG: AMP-binding protein [Thermoanaerobaculia bacterium]